jgi:transposase
LIEKAINQRRKPMAQEQPYPTIWELPDDLWEIIKQLLDKYDPPSTTGRPRTDRRPILNAIIHRFRTGCQWNHLPKEFGDDSTIHSVFQHWVKLNLFEIIWAHLVKECDRMKQVQWEWQAADAWLGKARMGEDKIGPNPNRSRKKWDEKELADRWSGRPIVDRERSGKQGN